MASTYRLGAPERTPARNSSFVAQCCCQRGSSTLGSYRSCTLPPLRHSNASRRWGAGSGTRTLPAWASRVCYTAPDGIPGLRERHRPARRAGGPAAGLAVREAVQRQAPLRPAARRHRGRPVRRLQEGRSRGGVRGGRAGSPGGGGRGARRGGQGPALDERGFTLVDSPILTPAACEGTSTLFEVPYFDLGKAYLTQSGQLYGEAAAMAVGKAYVFGPTFRAEKSKTRRHLTEFWMVEPEVAYMDLEGDMELAEDLLVEIVRRVLDKHERDLKAVLERDVEALRRVQKPFPRITYAEAIEYIQKTGHPIKWGDDMGADEETILCKQFDRPVLVHRYPAEMKAFYFKKDPKDPKVALGVDVLAPEGYGEIIGGGQREDDYAKLAAEIEKHKLPREAFEWYLDLRKYAAVPHAGFGLGVERTVSWICGLHHVRETIPFPRMMERLTP